MKTIHNKLYNNGFIHYARAVMPAVLALLVFVSIGCQNISANGSRNSEQNFSTASEHDEKIQSQSYSGTTSKIAATINNESQQENSELTSTSSAVLSSINHITKQPTQSNMSKSTTSVPQSKSQTSALQSSISSSVSISEDKTVILSGYIIDEDCYVSLGYHSNPSKEARDCLTMAICAASGYGVAVLQNDGVNYSFYYFDGIISGLTDNEDRLDNATGGQKYAWDFIDQHIQNKTIQVKVKGYFTGQKRTNPDKTTADGIYYEIFAVESIESA